MYSVDKLSKSDQRRSDINQTSTGPLSQGREFLWTNDDFLKVKNLIYQRAGINLHDGKHAMVYSRLSRRLRETGYSSFEDYLLWLEHHDGTEWQEFVNALTTNLTAFFREQHHFEILEKYIKAKPSGEKLRVWCSAASTGEEPYSILITILENIAGKKEFDLVASDIDSKVLEIAAKGIYKVDTLKNIDSVTLKKYFLRGKDSNSGYACLKPEFRRLLKFIGVNLIGEDWPFKELFDVVFCRNVMIYFDNVTQRSVLEKIHRTMRPGGMLFVGHAENFTEFRDLFILRGKTVYQRQ